MQSIKLTGIEPILNPSLYDLLNTSSETLNFSKTNYCLLVTEEGSDLDLDPPKPTEDAAEANCTDQPTVEVPASDGDEQPKIPNCDAECTPQDVTMSDAKTSSQIDSIKQLLLDRSKEYNIPQLERLYTSIMKGVFETKDRSEAKDVKSSILRFLFEFAQDQSRF